MLLFQAGLPKSGWERPRTAQGRNTMEARAGAHRRSEKVSIGLAASLLTGISASLPQLFPDTGRVSLLVAWSLETPNPKPESFLVFKMRDG